MHSFSYVPHLEGIVSLLDAQRFIMRNFQRYIESGDMKGFGMLGAIHSTTAKVIENTKEFPD